MDQKKKSRRVLRTSFTKTAGELEGLLSSPEGKERVITVSLELVKQKIEDLKRLDGDIYALMLEKDDTAETDLLAEMEGADGYVKRYTDLSLQCEECLQPRVKADPDEEVNSERSVSHSIRQGRRKFKLPILELKKFDGNIKDWLPFWSQFQKVHNDLEIDDNDKVEYLIQATVQGSRARQLVESFPATGSNYSKMVECLQARFGREDLQVEVYVRELLKLVIHNTSSGNRLDITRLYDKLETQLRALETLGITSDKYAAMLFPLVESCLPPELLRIWQRTPDIGDTGINLQVSLDNTGLTTIENRLKSLMNFLKLEVDNEQHVSLATEGFNLRSTVHKDVKRGGYQTNKAGQDFEPKFQTAMGLINSDGTTKCIFCQNSHESSNCFKAQKLGREEKKDILSKNSACFRCLKLGHFSRKCRARLNCIVCSKSHVTLMCPELPSCSSGQYSSGRNSSEKKDVMESVVQNVNQTLANSSNTHVFLQTLQVKVKGANKSKYVRALIDTGSQKTYLLKSTADFLGYQSKRQINVIHGLFGGTELPQVHCCYDVTLSHNNYSCNFEALDQPVICSGVDSVFNGPWMEELRTLNIKISDSHNSGPIELLIGSDIAGKLYTGKRHILRCGLVAVETLLGWVLMGKIPVEQKDTLSMSAVSLFVNNASISNLWELDVLGISDPVERKTREETALAAKALFLETVKTDAEGRYEVRLPWLEGHPALPSNYGIAKKRLDNTITKVTKDGYYELYDQVFKDWQSENIIEEVCEDQTSSKAHYLPHRPVIKLNSSTKIRPVFDASAREKDSPSLNQCLEKGVNLIEMISNILLRFRQQRIGVVSDIRKAFLQLSIHPDDRDFLRFLWRDKNGQEIIFRHRRVVFGINSSPFLLGASLEYHLSKMSEKCESMAVSKDIVVKLSKAFYVDNCVTSVANEEDLESFVKGSIMIMAEGRFDLRGWEYTGQVQGNSRDPTTSVLGIKWNRVDDTLFLNQDIGNIEELLSQPVTKRLMLSLAQRIFDPIGFSCPAVLIPKLLLQKTWEKQVGWDVPVNGEIESLFKNWLKEVPYLSTIKIARWINAGPQEAEQWSLHIFCDASKEAFSAVVFLRGVENGRVFVRLLGAKSRVAPKKVLSIPRLELMGALIAVRLYSNIVENFDNKLEAFFWSDSTTVLSWIERPEEWSTFVWNRISEIRKLSASGTWRHVPGLLNPADLPSRGCSIKQLVQSRWWEGPQWLYQNPFNTPLESLSYDEEEINRERRKKLVTVLINNERQKMSLMDWHLDYFSQYLKIIRMCAWISRFIYNTRNKERHTGPLSTEEINQAEIFVLRQVQQEFFKDNKNRLSGMEVFEDMDGVIRLKSRISNRSDCDNFLFPVILPGKHFLVNRLIFGEHLKLGHIGAQSLMCILRQNFWILGGRRAIRHAISKCVVCKRHTSKPVTVRSPPLPIGFAML
ncbi:uncharacterized protein LOC126737669 isoform X1 [Anthonomus grandis grandis]|uniref:uncharacterized protein LOC126737669 isoform X1 n=1 Tax=Anthonomus grandis grandis TaxID=2921223 RepID=UPI0021657882|nr:uncharacterized protein LOC126737669 isoform X1 [Anthonomus grandis grandis]XP_050298614.1 uncharacterized protein LOC126737669 isoform X1 [Anthonomus grandis grandis]XP_050298615.1 uncharacterized protein LOC126737669 isoform X1 [Anthonomus grandis grandis]